MSIQDNLLTTLICLFLRCWGKWISLHRHLPPQKFIINFHTVFYPISCFIFFRFLSGFSMHLNFLQFSIIFLLKQRFFHRQSHGKTPFKAVPPIFRASTSPWDNRNRFVSKEIMKYCRKQVRFHGTNLVSTDAVYAGWLTGAD